VSRLKIEIQIGVTGCNQNFNDNNRDDLFFGVNPTAHAIQRLSYFSF